MALVTRPTIPEYEVMLKNASALELIGELFLEDPISRAAVQNEIQNRAKWNRWGMMRPEKWMFFELRVAFEKYETKALEAPREAPKEPEKTQANPSLDLHEKNQARAVQAPFFGGSIIPPNTTKQ
jgi:hypothetical protein